MASASLRSESEARASSLGYVQRQPDKTLLYQTIQEHMATFFAQCESFERSLPLFIKEEFEAFLRCGILAHGFARVYCQECRYDRFVAFSCKKRGFCGSCMARRMSETAIHLVDSVIPPIPTRQWVLSVPVPMRYLMAYDGKALNQVINSFTGTLFSWLRKKAKQAGINIKSSQVQAGSVIFVQRFGSALNLNLHLHGQFSDGVFEKTESGEIIFHKTPAPTLTDIRAITEKIARRIHRWLQKQDSNQEQSLLSHCYASSLRYLSAFGANAGKPLMRVFENMPVYDQAREERTVAGFNLHASIAIAAEDRQGLERLLRYMGRPPLSEDRLAKTKDGKLILRLKTPWSDGTSKIILSPLELIERLVALIPPPRKHMIRYAGVFASNSHFREQIRPKPVEDSAAPAKSKHAGCRKSWAELMKRIFDVDVLQCPRCHSQMQVIAFITEGQAIRDILASVGLATAPPEIARACHLEQQEQFSFDHVA